MVGGGPFRLEPGQWVDDTMMALCVAASLVQCKGFDARDQTDRYLRWRGEGCFSSTGTCFDIGGTAAGAPRRYERIGLAGTRLRIELDRVLLWRGDHVSVQQLVEDFARYPYLPRLRDSSVLLSAIEEGVGLLTWAEETFGYADTYDEAEGRFRGLRGGVRVTSLEGNPSAVLVKAEVAAGILSSRKLAKLTIEPSSVSIAPGGNVSFSVRGEDQNGQAIELSGVTWKAEGGTIDGRGLFTAGLKEGSFQIEATVGQHSATASVAVSARAPEKVDKPEPRPGPRRFHGSVALRPLSMAKEAGQIAEEVIAHLEGLVGAEVSVTLEIEAHIPGGAPEHVVRIVAENCRTLKFASHGFEEE